MMVAAKGIEGEPRDLCAAEIDAVPAQLGVFEILDGDGQVVYIGQAGGNEPFGMRSALTTAAERLVGSDDESLRFRHEFTHGYRSRWIELLMLYHAKHQGMPEANQHDLRLIGRLR